MEYLMTYGWAILIIAVVLGALFSLGVFNSANFAPKAPPGACQVFRPNGPGSTSFINLEGVCSGELPQYVAYVNQSISYIRSNTGSIDSVFNGGSWTITSWINEMLPILNGGYWQLIVEATGCPGSGLVDGSISTTTYGVDAVEGNEASVTCSPDGASDTTPIITVPINTWIMAVSVFHYNPNGASWVAICVNSICTNQSWTEGTPADYTQYQPEVGFVPGGCCGGNTRFWTGQIANVQIYNTSLSGPEVNALYLEGIGGAPIDLQNLVGWWPLNGNANDYSGNGNNGVPNNVMFTSSWTSGYTAP